VPQDDLTPDEVLTLGGWNRRYARVLRVERAGDDAVALVDTNGDGSEIEADGLRRQDGRWQSTTSWGFGPLGQSFHSWTAGSMPLWLGGCAPPGTRVAASQGGGPERFTTADEHGLWLFVEDSRSLPDGGDWTGVGPRWRLV
jgi:hypothetical protein